MKNFSIKEALGYGWGTFKQNKKLLMLGALVVVLVGNLQNSDMVMEDASAFVKYPIVILFFFLSTLISIGWYKLLFKVMDGEATGLKELFAHSRMFFRYLWVTILCMLVVGIPVGLGVLAFVGALALQMVWLGAVFGVIGAAISIYAALRYSLVFAIIIDKDTGVGRSFKESAKLTEGVKWKLAGLVIVALLVNTIGVIALVVGVLVSIPVTTLAFLHIYRQLTAPQNP